MFTPVRGVMAAQQTHCDMADMDMAEVAVSMNASMSTAMQGHEMHYMSSADMSADLAADQAADLALTDQSVANKQCCCCDNDCMSNCDMGVTASLVMQVSAYTPDFVKTTNSISYTSEILVRALTPPSRPPANLS